MPKPSRVKLKKHSNPAEEWEDGELALGEALDLKVDGVSADPNANELTGVLIRVFYRAKGIPYAVTLFNGLATTGGAKAFDTAGVGQFFKSRDVGYYSLTAHAWDHKDPHTANRIQLKSHKVDLKIK